MDTCGHCHICHIDVPQHLQGNKHQTELMRGWSKESQEFYGGMRTQSSHDCNATKCKECYGCEHRLTHLQGPVHLLNTSFSFERGKTRAQIFKTESLHDGSPDKCSVVKIWGIPVLEEVDSNRTMICKPDKGTEKLKVCYAYKDLIPSNKKSGPENLLSRLCSYLNLVKV